MDTTWHHCKLTLTGSWSLWGFTLLNGICLIDISHILSPSHPQVSRAATSAVSDFTVPSWVPSSSGGAWTRMPLSLRVQLHTEMVPLKHYLHSAPREKERPREKRSAGDYTTEGNPEWKTWMIVKKGRDDGKGLDEARQAAVAQDSRKKRKEFHRFKVKLL